MLRISRRSWHMRLMETQRRPWEPPYEPRDLCTHFWNVAGVLALWGVLTVAAITVLGAVGVACYWFVVWHLLPHWRAYAGLAVVVAGVVMLTVGALWVADQIDRRRERRRQQQPKPQRSPGLLRSWLKAKKARVCPLLEVVD